MVNRTWILRIVLGIAVLAAAGWCLMPRSSGKRPRAANSKGDAGVLVARRYIPAFSVLGAQDIEVRRYPKSLVPPGALQRREDLVGPEGRPLLTAAIAIPEGHPLTRALTVDASRPESLTALLRPGKVAVSFEVDRAHGVGGWIKPGDRIALFKSGKSLRLLLPSVLVLAVDRTRLGEKPREGASAEDPLVALARDAADDSVVTVMVSPLEASHLIAARDEATLSLVLRPLEDELPGLEAAP